MHDLVVVGAGPAGSSAAYRAARRGMNVLLLEKEELPRMKICGGALSEHAMSFLEYALPEDLIETECYGARVQYGEANVSASKSERIAVLVSRESFDHFLANKAQEAGAELIHDEAISIQETTAGIECVGRNQKYTARAAIVAQGASGRLIKSVRPLDGPDAMGVCLEARVPKDLLPQSRPQKGIIDIYFGIARFGYGWVFDHGTYYSIGIGGLRSLVPAPRPAFEDFCRNLSVDPGEIHPRGHLIPCGGLKRRLGMGKILLAGDSAGFVDPFYGEGIAYAIRSGQLAVEALSEASFEPCKALRHYQRSCRREFGANLWYSLQLARLMHRFPDQFIRLLAQDETVLEKYLDVPLHVTTYKRYLIWLLMARGGTILKNVV